MPGDVDRRPLAAALCLQRLRDAATDADQFEPMLSLSLATCWVRGGHPDKARDTMRALKKDFGDDLTFWGGGVETQEVLPNGTPEEVREDVKRNLDALAPGGGYVFNTVHNIQSEVPPENIVAMWEALQEFGRY